MAGIEGLDRDGFVHMRGSGDGDKMLKDVRVCFSYYSIVLLNAGHTDSFPTWLTILLFAEIHVIFIPPEYVCVL